MGNRNRHANVPCGKACFPTRPAVRRALGRYQKRWAIYWCPPCEAYHVAGTSSGATAKRQRTHTTLVRTGLDDEPVKGEG